MRNGALFFVVVLMSGCAGAAPDPAVRDPWGADVVAAPPQFSEWDGAISGYVVDAEFVPVFGAVVTLSSGGLTSTDVQGRFTFSHVQPGTYGLAISKAGFANAERIVDVYVGTVVEISVSLVGANVDGPYSETYHRRGIHGCDVTTNVAPGVNVCGFVGLLDLLVGVNTTTIDESIMAWNISGPSAEWRTGVFELAWASTQALGSGLLAYWEVNKCPGDPKLTFGAVSGRSPLQLRSDAAQIQSILSESSKPRNCRSNGVADFDTSTECNFIRCNVQSRVFSSPETTGQAVDAGASVQQSFDAWVTNFYGASAPDSFTVFDDE